MEGVLGLVVIVLIIYGFIRLNNYAGDSLARKKGIRCPNCGSSEIRQKSGTSFKVNFGSGWKTMIDYKCKSCRHKYTRYE